MRIVFAYFAALLVMLGLDYVWLAYLMRSTYEGFIGPLMLAEPKLAPAAVFYLLYITGLLVFAILPGMRAQDGRCTAALSALFGLIAYATYDLSNLATLKGWSLELAVIDIAWGAVLSCVAGVAGYLAGRDRSRRPGLKFR